MPWRVELSPTARRELAALPPKVRSRIAAKIELLVENARPPGCKKLKGEDDYRLRSGDDRIVYEIHDKILQVIVIRVGHRARVYRRLPGK